MKQKLCYVLLFALLLNFNFLSAQQDNNPEKPIYVGTPTKVERVPSLASRMGSLQYADLTATKEMQDGRTSIKESRVEVIPGKGSSGDDVLAQNPHRLKNAVANRAPSLVFETGASSSQPTDPAGAVGPNHYISVINTAYQIFDKNGNSLTGGLLDPTTIFPSGGCCDLTASYDNAADRWVISFLGSGVQIAVSDGPDPVNDGWSTYTYSVVNDYQKLSVWSDGYYMTENTTSANKVHVFDRAAMLNGDASAAIQSFALPGLVTSGFHAPQALNISSNSIPSTGGATIVYMQDDAWAGVSNDHIKLWTIDIDWNTPANSTISGATEFGLADGVSAFTSVFDGGSFSNLTQPGGGDIDALQATVMNQAQFRKFSGYNSAIFNFVVDVDGSATEQAGVRWYELRQTGDNQPWTVYQEGTYTAPDNRHAWNASMIMDLQGNIGMGYTSMSSANSNDSTVRVGSYYTGQMASSSGTGTMDVAEGTIAAGGSDIPGFRYGDYSKIDIDPDGDKKFWFVNEVMQLGRKNVCGVFQLAPNTNNDVGIISIDTPVSGALTNVETVTVTVFNYGENPASGFNVTYQIDGGTVISEPFVGTLATQTSAQHVFSATANLSTEGQTYSITACTDLTGDEYTNNDCISADIEHVLANDIGVTAITAPVSGEGLTNETVTITIENFGTSDQSNFDVNYIVDGGTPVVETVAATVPAGGTISYSFTALANLSAVATYAITSSTLLGTDSDASNNMASTSVTNISCMSLTSNDTPLTIDATSTTVTSVITFTDDFTINDVNVTLNIEHAWNDDLDVYLIAPDGTTQVELFTDIGSSGDNFTGTVLDDEATDVIPDSSSEAPFTGTYQPEGSLADFDGMSSLGDWTLSVTDDYPSLDDGILLDWTLQLCGDLSLGLEDNLVNNDNFTVIHEGDNQYTIELATTTITERLELSVINTLGQIVSYKTLENETGLGYEYKLDMSYAASGVYFVKIGNRNASNVKRIIVE